MAQDMTLREVAHELRLSSATIYRWLKSGYLRGYRLGGTKAGWRIPEAELERLRSSSDREGLRFKSLSHVASGSVTMTAYALSEGEPRP